MNIKKLLNITFLTLTFTFIFSVCSFASYSETMNEYKNPDGKTLIVSDMGNDTDYPENSAEGIKSDIENGADIVKINLQRTKDGKIVVFSDLNLLRMTDTDKNISDLTYDEIKNLKLKNGNGDSQNSTTDCIIPLLSDILSSFKDTVFMLDFDFTAKDEIYGEVKSSNALDRVIFYIGHQKNEDISLWLSSLEAKPEIMTYFKGNVIFVATAYVKSSAGAGADGIALATKNPYGVIFGKTVMNKCKNSNIRAMALCSRSELCGTIRQDNTVWWDDLISRGFSMLLTDNVKELKEYLADTEKEYNVLRNSYNSYMKDYILPDFTTTTYIDYKKAYNDAKTEAERLLSMNNIARSEVVKATTSLIDAKTDIINDYDKLSAGTAGVTITPGRIITAVLAVIGVVWWEIFVYRHIKKGQCDK